MQNFDEFMNVTEPTMTVGTRTTGTLMAWGTATAANMQIFEQNFYNPRAFGFMAFENVLIMMLVMKFVDSLNLMLGVLKEK